MLPGDMLRSAAILNEAVAKVQTVRADPVWGLPPLAPHGQENSPVSVAKPQLDACCRDPDALAAHSPARSPPHELLPEGVTAAPPSLWVSPARFLNFA